MLASLERNLLPDAVIRRLCRKILADRLHSGYKASVLEHQIVEKMLADIHSFELEPSHDCIFSIGIFELNKTGLMKSSSMELQCLQLICFFISR
ncbi:hypothetical protein CUMW_029100 [Citrus unshiu]|nr:hypothetical protein CUMW_029100 [Citrus unshiu]